jgi:hypothetical protein
MIATRKMLPLIGALICVTLGSMTSALALTAEVAKKCAGLTAKAFPQQETGNPAARSGGGTGLSPSNLGISARGDPAAQSRSPSLSYSKTDFDVLPDNNHGEKSVAAISAMI